MIFTAICLLSGSIKVQLPIA